MNSMLIAFFTIGAIPSFASFVSTYASLNFNDEDTITCYANKRILVEEFNYENISDSSLYVKRYQRIHQNQDIFTNIVLSGLPMLIICSYLGPQKVGAMEQVSKSIKDFYTKSTQSVSLWKGYAHRLQIDIKDCNNPQELIIKVKNYYLPVIEEINIDASTIITNADGSIMAGSARDGLRENRETAFVWYDDSIKSLEMFNNGTESGAKAINSAGNIIVGWEMDEDDNDKEVAVVWTNCKIRNLEMLNNGKCSFAADINSAGTIISGWATNGQDENRETAVIWEKSGIKSLGMLNNGMTSYGATLNSDGTIVAGWARDGQNDNRDTAVIWEKNGIKSLGMLNNGIRSYAAALNSDGTIVAGWARDGQNENRDTAVVWRNGNIKPLPILNGMEIGHATKISGDGAVVAGEVVFSSNHLVYHPVIWNNNHILILNDYPFNGSHDHLTKIQHISKNGSDFIVSSINGYGFKHYRAHIPRWDLWTNS